MSKIDIHIVSFDVPLPQNYGGVIDVFNRLKSLHQAGFKIALHCFEYGRGKNQKLEQYCEQLYYYSRSYSVFKHLNKYPFIVGSRSNKRLLEGLKQDNAPILFEGHHCTYYLDHPDLISRTKVVRTHNIEQEYYMALSNASNNIFRKIYYQREAKKLQCFEEKLAKATAILAISPSDQHYFERINSNSILLQPFHSYRVKEEKKEILKMALYHGNLSVEENHAAALYFIKLFNELDFPLTIAGRNPKDSLRKMIKEVSNVSLIANPSEYKMSSLIQQSHLNCLYTNQATGIKLKLIRALIEGNEVIVNSKMIEGTSLIQYCQLANGEEEWKKQIKTAFQKEVNQNKIIKRRQSVLESFNNEKGVDIIRKFIKP